MCELFGPGCVFGHMKTLVWFAAMFLAAGTLSAADISGKWFGSLTLPGPGGESQHGTAYVIFQQKGTELTGTGGADASQQWPIQKGSIQGDKITFQVQQPDGPLYKVECTLVGDRILGEIAIVLPDGQTAKGTLEITPVK